MCIAFCIDFELYATDMCHVAHNLSHLFSIMVNNYRKHVNRNYIGRISVYKNMCLCVCKTKHNAKVITFICYFYV